MLSASSGLQASPFRLDFKLNFNAWRWVGLSSTTFPSILTQEADIPPSTVLLQISSVLLVLTCVTLAQFSIGLQKERRQMYIYVRQEKYDKSLR
jgi:hypothetical protein